MGMNWHSTVLYPGCAQGDVLRLDAAISFWGGIDPVTSKITLSGHPQHGLTIAGKMLVIPRLIGSSSSSAIMLELVYAGMAPSALILGARDAILPIGVLVAGQMNWNTIPVVTLDNPPFQNTDTLQIKIDGTISKIARRESI